ncbi:MAG: branched-chain amino acid ABC transporter permease [Acidimicrobiales bacterium]
MTTLLSSVGTLVRRAGVPGVLLTIIVVALPLLLSDLRLNQLTRQLVLVLAILGVSMLTGRAGVVSLGHGVFVGIGAFATASSAQAGVPLLLAVPVGIVVAAAFGVILGLPALRVRGPHLALITLGTALAFEPLAKKVPAYTGGSSGIRFDTSSFDAPSVFGGRDATAEWHYVVSLLVIAGWFVLARNLNNSRVGRAIQATNDNEIAAATFGISARWAKTGALGISAAMAGTGGALYAVLTSFLLSSEFDALLSFRLYAAAVLGGVQSLAGPIYGIIVLVVVPEIAERISFLGNQDIVFGLAVVLVTLLAPGGAAEAIGRLRNLRGGRRVR